MSVLKNFLYKFALISFMLSLPVASLAQQGGAADGKIVNPLPRYNSIPALIQGILEGVLKIGIPVIALAIIYSGFLFVAARGNSEKLTKAKSALLYTLIGAAILLGSWAIAKLISETVISVSS